MKATTLPRLVAVLGAAALWTLISPAPAAAIVCAGICLDFMELANEGGITVTETGGTHARGWRFRIQAVLSPGRCCAFGR